MKVPERATVRRFFPNPRLDYEDGLVGASDDLTVEMLIEAYSFGLFPWPYDETPILWFCPDPRGVLFLNEFHISKSLQKFLKKTDWKVTRNTVFDQVIDACASVERKESGTWINSLILNSYKELHKLGYAHSIEVWEDDQLIGGMYGVMVGGVFCGESMFSLKSNASKVALVNQIEFLKSLGHGWMDIQMVTPHLEKMGGKYITKSEYLDLLSQTQKKV